MVNDVFRVLFDRISQRLAKHQGAYEQLIAYYCKELVHGIYANILYGTKFEALNSLIKLTSGLENMNSLLRAIFYCEEGQFNYNHAAIASLLKNGNMPLCVTTNFDNAIERASGLRAWVLPEHPPIGESVEPMILKLHGDVNANRYAATDEDLLEVDTQQEFAYLRESLQGRTTLFAGYSAMGDVDIAPQLLEIAQQSGKHKSNLIWFVRPGGNPRTEVPPFATHYLFCDLHTDRTKEDSERIPNYLLKLAGMTPEAHDARTHPAWEQNIEAWVQSTAVEFDGLSQLVGQLCATRNGSIPIHLHSVRCWERGDDCSNDIDMTYKMALMIRAGFYFSGLRLDQEIKSSTPKIEAVRQYWKGFANWRLGRLDKALQAYQSSIHAAKQLSNREDMDFFGEKHLRIAHGDTRTRVLEAALDKLLLLQKPYRRKVIQTLEQTYNLFELTEILGSEMAIRSGQLLNAMIAESVRLRLGQPLDSEKILKLYEKARDLKRPEEATPAVRLLLYCRLFVGLRVLRENFGELWRRRTWAIFLQNVFAIPQTLLSFLPFAAYVFQALAAGSVWVLTQDRERRFRKQRLSWHEEYARLDKDAVKR